MILVGELVTTRNHPTTEKGIRLPKLPMVVYMVKSTSEGRWVRCQTSERGLKCIMHERNFQPWDFDNSVDFEGWHDVPSFTWEQ